MTATAPRLTRRQAEDVLAEAETRRAERRLSSFVRQSWPIIEPKQPLLWNWHIDAICEHLEAVSAGQISNLIINVPPGTMKSTLASVMWPAWLWTQQPDRRFLCASHDQGLSSRDNMHMRDIVVSEWYQDRWQLRLRDDQNAKTRFDTTAGGWRIGTSVGGKAIGEHPHFKIVDDPHKMTKKGALSAVAMLSDNELDAVIHWYSNTLTPRGMGLGAATVVIMQRLHTRDLSGHMLAELGEDVVHLCLPMKHEPGRTGTTSIGWRDPRTQEGELLWPALHTAEKVAKAARPMGAWGEASQFQQRPAPKGGAMFQRTWFKVVTERPRKVARVVRFWDVAGTAGGTGPRTVGMRMSLSADDVFTIEHIRKGRWDDKEVDDEMKLVARMDGRHVVIREEQEPGSSGKKVIAVRRRMLKAYDYAGVAPDADKVTRARPLAGQAHSGNVQFLVPEDDEEAAKAFEDFLREVETFPFGLKDQVDAASGALGFLTGEEEVDQASLDDGAQYPLYY